jgi:hypothetical protein
VRELRCAAPHCLSYPYGPHLLSVAVQLEYEVELAEGLCLCREALERSDSARAAPPPPTVCRPVAVPSVAP